MKRRPPDHRCHGTPVLRDVAPGKVPLAIDNEDGTPWMVFDLDVELVDAVEEIAKKRRRSFPFMMTRILPSGIRLKLREWRGF